MLKSAHNSFPGYLFVVLSTLIFLSCAHTPEIIGKWQEPGKTSAIEFDRDGTFTAVDDMGMTVRGQYILQEDGRVLFEIKHPGASVEIITGTLAVKDDELKISIFEANEVITYKKAAQ